MGNVSEIPRDCSQRGPVMMESLYSANAQIERVRLKVKIIVMG
jgi:hypothetical protein